MWLVSASGAAGHMNRSGDFTCSMRQSFNKAPQLHIQVTPGSLATSTLTRYGGTAFRWCDSLSLASYRQQPNPSFPCSLITPGFRVINERGQSQMPQFHLHLAETKPVNQGPAITHTHSRVCLPLSQKDIPMGSGRLKNKTA